MSSCSVVSQGERGISVSLGKAGAEPRQPGAYLWLPFFLGNVKMNVQTQRSDVKTSAASKDMQEIQTELAVNWSINPEDVVKVYTAVGTEDDILERIISPAVSEVMKAAIAKRTAEEVLTGRMELKKDIDDGLKSRLNLNGVVLADVSIVNFTFSQEFTKAIEHKQVAEQRAKQAEYEAAQKKAEARGVVEQAKGEAEAMLARAQAEAKSKQVLQSTLSPEILKLEYLKRWNGNLPNVMAGNSSGVMLNLPMTNTKTKGVDNE